MSQTPDQGGKRASENGRKIEDLIREMLIESGQLRENKVATKLESLMRMTNSDSMLFDDGASGVFSRQCELPLYGEAHRERERVAVVDFVIVNRLGEPSALSVKSQKSDGSAQEKLWFEIQQLIDSQIPSAMYVHGPSKGSDEIGRRTFGWCPKFLLHIWDLARANGKNVFLFRSEERLIRWMKDGFPVPGKGRTAAQISSKYCDLFP